MVLRRVVWQNTAAGCSRMSGVYMLPHALMSSRSFISSTATLSSSVKNSDTWGDGGGGGGWAGGGACVRSMFVSLVS